MSRSYLLRLPILILLLSLPVIAQENAVEVLTNEKVVTMVQAGLPASIVINKIRASSTNFNTSTEELIRLKQSHVPDDVINVMVNPNAGYSANADNNGPPKEIGCYI